MDGIIDFHTHTLASDGILTYSEHVRRAVIAGYSVIGIADHVDSGNFNFIVDGVLTFIGESQKYFPDIIIIPAVELTHVMPDEIPVLTKRARERGIKLVIVHGETRNEPVIEGTNRSAIDACVDILAHPGFITYEEAQLAAKNGVYLELTPRGGHSLTNAHVAAMAIKAQAKLVVNSDFHTFGNQLTHSKIKDIIFGSNVGEEEYKKILQNSIELTKRIMDE